jgi:hypothetical protein
MRRQITDSFFGFMIVMIFILGVGGWIWNIVKIVQTLNAELTGMFIARCIGVFVAPIGAVLGFF